MTDIESKLCTLCPEADIYEYEPLSEHTTFKVGGPARLFVSPHSIEELALAVSEIKKSGEPWFLLGRGSNVLVSDKGFDGVVIHVAGGISDVQVNGNNIIAGAGANLSAIAKAALDAGLGGLEFASGIPGSLGGAIYMNAGAYGGEIKDVCTEVTLLDEAGNICKVKASDMEFSYRHSAAMDKGYIICGATFSLQPKDPSDIKALMDDFAQRRKDKQPLEYPSAGSTFKRPEGYFAGALIEQAGLSGYSIGGAAVSDKHCGFVINKDSATASDIYNLCKHIQKTVQDKFGVQLELEVRTLGDFS